MPKPLDFQVVVPHPDTPDLCIVNGEWILARESLPAQAQRLLQAHEASHTKTVVVDEDPPEDVPGFLASMIQPPIIEANPESPYKGLPLDEWLALTERLIRDHPLTLLLNSYVRRAWASVVALQVGPYAADRLGLPPQLVGNLFHCVLALEIEENFPGWRRPTQKLDKDVVCEATPLLSIEIKTSSHPTQVFGNRSFALSYGPKVRSGYYLTVNFSFPQVNTIRFGWLDQTDWVAQVTESGQQARLTKEAMMNKLIPV